MARLKFFGRKIRYAKKLRENRLPPFWVMLRKFGRPLHPMRLRRKRDWRHNKIKL